MKERSKSNGEVRRAALTTANTEGTLLEGRVGSFAGRHKSWDCRILQSLFLFEIQLLMILPVIKVTTPGHLVFAMRKTS